MEVEPFKEQSIFPEYNSPKAFATDNFINNKYSKSKQNYKADVSLKSQQMKMTLVFEKCKNMNLHPT
jgi:hypothetical protein